jgi:hypothetical protein
MKVKIGKYTKAAPRRINIAIDKYDTWSMDHTLALIILPALLQYKEIHHGVPNEFADHTGDDNANSQMSFEFYKESHDWAFEESVKKWDEALDKMIWSFYQIVVDDDSKYYHGKAEYDWVKSDKQFPNPVSGKVEDTYQMVDKNPQEHWYDAVGHMEHEKRVQEGLELFGKYFRNLWD